MAIITSTIAVWAEYATLKLSFTRGASELYIFITMSLNAKNKMDVKHAAHHFANTLNLSGISAISALLLRACIRPVVTQEHLHLRSRQTA